MPPSNEEKSTNPRVDGLLVALSFASGAMDAVSFLGLGKVFTSVITGNLVLLGINLVRDHLRYSARAGAALASYAVGVFIASKVANRSHHQTDEIGWPIAASRALVVESLAAIALATGWYVTKGRPDYAQQLVLIGVAACTMGMQSGATHEVKVRSLSTTYLTGTLTWVVNKLAKSAKFKDLEPQALSLPAVVLGAISAALTLDFARPFAAVIPSAVVLCVAILANSGWSRGGADSFAR